MHIVLGLLGTIVTILYLLSRLSDIGINLGALNPFYWRRRRAWRKKYEGDPLFAVNDPTEVAALFVIGVAKLDAEISAEQKKVALAEFERKFSLGSNEASQLLGLSAHLLGQPQVIGAQLDGLLSKHKETFSTEQISSLLEMMTQVVNADGGTNEQQTEFLAKTEELLGPPPREDSVWGKGS